jgi:hypothetical protein
MANTSYQSKSKNKPTGQLPSQVRKKMEEERLKIINKARVAKARKEDKDASSTPLSGAGYYKPGTKPDRARKAKANRAKSQGGRSFAQAGTTKAGSTLSRAAKTKRDITAKITAAEKAKKQSTADKIAARDADMNIKKSPPAAKKSTAKTWKDVTSISAAKAAGLNYYSKGGKKMAAVTKADLDKSGLSLRDYLNYKTGKTRKAAPKKTTATAKKAAPKKPTTKSKDPRGNQIKATPGKKGPLASARKEYPVTGPGSQSKILRPKKAAAKIPAGAKPFTGKYDSKKFKLQNINGKTFVVKR